MGVRWELGGDYVWLYEGKMGLGELFGYFGYIAGCYIEVR